MIEEVRGFLSLFEGEPVEVQTRLLALVGALDNLARAYHQSKRNYFGSPVEPPRESHDVVLILKYFPDFGFYPTIDPLADLSEPPVIANAANDLADIRRDLLEVAWRWENIGEADAEDSFCESYEIHWGRHHLPGLRHYVSVKLLGL